MHKATLSTAARMTLVGAAKRETIIDCNDDEKCLVRRESLRVIAAGRETLTVIAAGRL